MMKAMVDNDHHDFCHVSLNYQYFKKMATLNSYLQNNDRTIPIAVVAQRRRDSVTRKPAVCVPFGLV